MSTRLAAAARDINPRTFALSAVVGAVPAAGLLILSAISIGPFTWPVALGGWAVFTWSAYGKPTFRARVGSALFWFAVVAFLAPVAMFAFLYSWKSTGPLWANWLVSAGFFVVTWMLSWAVGSVLYLLSTRLEG